MDNDMFMNENGQLYNYYDHDDSPPDYRSSCRPYRFSHLYPTTTDLSPAFNACMVTTSLDSCGVNDEYDPLFDTGDLSSILRLRNRQHSVLPSATSSSFNMASRFPYSHFNNPPVKMEFNEDVLVMDGILLNQVPPAGRSSRRSLLGSSSCSSSSTSFFSGSHYGTGSSGICKPPPLNHQIWKKPPSLVSARPKGKVPDPRDQIPKDVADSRNLWAGFNRAHGISSTPPNGSNGAEAGESSIPTAGASEVTSTVSNNAGGSGDPETERSSAAKSDSSSSETTSERMASSSNDQDVESNEQEADFTDGDHQSTMRGPQSSIEFVKNVVQTGQNVTAAAKVRTSASTASSTVNTATTSARFSSSSLKTQQPQHSSPCDGQTVKMETMEPFLAHEIEVKKKGKTVVWNENVPCTAARYGRRLPVFETLSGRNVDAELNKKTKN